MMRQFELVELVKSYDPNADEALLNRAYVYSMKAHGAQLRASGDPYFSHPIQVAGLLAQMKLDTASIVTGLLHDTIEDTVATLDDIERQFGPEVGRLVDRIATRRERLRPALERFADELDHPLGDMVVTSLLLASERQGRLGDLLSEVARSARQTATMRLRVEAARSRTYVTTRLIVGITVVIATWLLVFRRDYLAPFDSAGGQVMIVVIGAVFLGAGMSMRRMAEPTEPARLLGRESPA